MVSLEYAVTIVEQVLKSLNTEVDPIALFLPDNMYMVTNGQIRVISFFSKSLTGSQLNWSATEKECYGIDYGVKLFESHIH